MRRAIAVLVPMLLIVVSAAPARGQEAPPPLAATLAACQSGATADERFAVFTGSMPAMRGTRRMAMRFDLAVRATGEKVWTAVRARGFGRWQRSEPGHAGFVYTKRVERLAQAASYRVIVRFRWFGAAGVQRTTLRRTAVCRQPDQRPNLQIETVLALGPGAEPGTSRYAVYVINTGRTAAGAFDVGEAGAPAERRRSIAGLPAGERATVEVVSSSGCAPGDVLDFRVDAGKAVDEARENDNGLIRPC